MHIDLTDSPPPPPHTHPHTHTHTHTEFSEYSEYDDEVMGEVDATEDTEMLLDKTEQQVRKVTQKHILARQRCVWGGGVYVCVCGWGGGWVCACM